ncbi:MAG: tetratricopeptide repeat protein [Candidatus Cryptobacteroides sp.]
MKKTIAALAALLLVLPLFAQEDKKEVRSGNRMLRNRNYNEAEINFRKGLVKDSTSFISSYDLASSLYLQKDYDNAAKALEKVEAQLPDSGYADRWHFNKGNIALQQQDYQTAVEAFKQALLLNPGDLEAKESYIYAKKKLEEQQNQQGDQGNQGDNQDNQNDNQQQDQPDQQPDPQDNQQNEQQPQEAPAEQQISPQQAQQMLKAIQAKEKETQEKVEKAKAQQAQTRRKENNW